ncbi:uncharacterized protein si:ch211-199g17.2 isoform X2 [Plectropomus leopardus]|uniref:uncharacterized protein si:ch211-199g17.2 isoform X2 n=1 Tax=Plectropomus leopardus TaxID=160734 RepID=UPI001C4CC38A|nr:uncharacterized protein si:ch211-199g17.2 isoform X2 [Plectropomus leopardus]
MQPVEAQKGVSTKSQLFDSLKVYLNNKNRLQPIIGLGSIIECVKAGTDNRDVLYLCEVCVCRKSKADMRNHIMGSLHRYNYIKAWHPHLVREWKEKSDLSKLAWPLMEMAKILERKEGPGDVQWLEVENAVYQKMATHSENDAVTLITLLRDGQGERPIQSQRIVLLSQNMDNLKTSAETDQSVTFTKPEDWLKSASPEPSALSEHGNNLFDGYTGTTPLIGLTSMVECRSEDGHTHCFLCHCCRIRSNKKDIIDHLTSSSHLVNFLMETYPEQVEVMMTDINENYQLLQSLARKVEREEGRGEPKVVNAPESLCILLTSKSYHWWSSVNKTSTEGMPEKCAVVPSQQAKKKPAKRKWKGVTNTVFKVSLPLTKGPLLLERTSVSRDSLPGTSPSFHSDLIPPPEFPLEDCELDYDTGFFAVNDAEHTSQLQQDSGDEDAGQYMEPERNVTVTQHHAVDGYFSHHEYFDQSGDMSGTKYQTVYGDNYHNRQHGSQERPSKRFYKERQNEGTQTQNEWLSPAASHTEDWPSYNSYYGHDAGCSEPWCYLTSQCRVDSRLSRGERQNKMRSYATQHYYQQQPQSQYMAQDHTSLQGGSVGQRGVSDLAAHSDPSRIYTHHHVEDSYAHSDSVAAEPRVQALDTEQRPLQTYMEFTYGHVQAAQQSYKTQTTAHQTIQVSQGAMSNPNYSIAPWTNSDPHFLHPPSNGGGDNGSMSQSNAFITPGQALCHGVPSDLSFRAAGFSDSMISRRSDGTTPFMFAYPSFNSTYITTLQ